LQRLARIQKKARRLIRQLKAFSDARLFGRCVYCGGPPETDDHLPSKILLDDPLPANLHTVSACLACNSGYSYDEEYLACLLEVVRLGSTEDIAQMRPKIRDTLSKQTKLAARLNAARTITSAGVFWAPEIQRVTNIASKLAQGHAAYELSEPQYRAPDRLAVLPLSLMREQQLGEFQDFRTQLPWPEVGSRAMIRLAEGCPDSIGGWIVVQPGMYRYLASVSSGLLVRIVLDEYLACEARWN
jgi:hypothetical protein